MKKIKIPKKIAGYRVPKMVRKSPVLKAMLKNKTGRDVLAQALVAGAGAAAAVLVEERENVAGAAKSGGKKGAKALGIVGEAFHRGSDAAIEVVREASGSMLPKKLRKDRNENPQKGGAVH
ncbi:hypothetical protein [Pseudorhizobium pelagicum]|uniref:Uncharacterized protein n=1 Tax=Pseudorhizobium pelagicum TaxID=1509405 RepID=A0A922T889_9HYPH|nr:hypothetical protein [Pseudorhizobium pelagicum]KEQ02900.1 hypothetical protein GV67_16460 [Pseudorhizobium pelagicum]KEQ03083.1 hypothetical protein GV68_18095 [Pseudorhizobium pelagicum]